MIVGVPVHDPVDAVKVCPSWAVPEIAGSAVLTGGAAVIVLVAADVALAFPTLLVAVTVAFSVSPT